MGHTYLGRSIPGSFTVHPHLRGAYGGRIARRSGEARFIPTYVGHTCLRRPCRTEWPVHPHIRGAYFALHTAKNAVYGSSPHTWGILIMCAVNPLEIRFIPTYVGHTWSAAAADRPLSGSSPHTWGIPGPATGFLLGGRFIPTYVGHTSSTVKSCVKSSVHPHIRGAYRKFLEPPRQYCGSSPHTWGILSMMPLAVKAHRFIPTYVGHTFCFPVRPAGETVHPHLRGAYGLQNTAPSHCQRFIPTYVGHTDPPASPPLPPICSLRFIPTYVGHTLPMLKPLLMPCGSSPPTWGIPRACPFLWPPPTVHPHLRGAYRQLDCRECVSAGSSPPTWGIRCHGLKFKAPIRFIPTYVGHTPVPGY